MRPGLTGLAQVRGRNDIDWQDKLDYDIEYLKSITFFGDVKIIIQTVIKVLKCDGITEEGTVTSTDFGDYLLKKGEITEEVYNEKQSEAKAILNKEVLV